MKRKNAARRKTAVSQLQLGTELKHTIHAIHGDAMGLKEVAMHLAAEMPTRGLPVADQQLVRQLVQLRFAAKRLLQEIDIAKSCAVALRDVGGAR